MRQLLCWATKSGRRPPWRLSSDLYELGVAEILLQKTKAEDVEKVWRPLIDQYPCSSSLAVADDEALLRVIGHLGLGPQRAGRLKSMAAALAKSPGPGPVPGLGPYGSGVLALADNRNPRAPPVDGNIARVMSRYLGVSFGRGEARKKTVIRDAVATLLARRSPRRKLALVYALVDLGAAVCTPKSPNCAGCPLSRSCASAAFAEAL